MTETQDDVEDPRGEAVGWLELFFDLVVVAAVAALTHALRDEPTAFGLGLFVVLYAAIWMTWTNVVLYTDVSGSQTSLRTVLAVMALIAVMAATNPIHHEERANFFAVAFVLARVWVSRGAIRTGKVLGSWPLLQFGGFTVPWIVSLWVDEPWKYALWAFGITVDLVMVSVRGDEMVDRQVARMQALRDEHPQDHRRERRAGPGRDPRTARLPAFTRVGVDESHVAERLGLLVIIVLGEAVIQLVDAGAEVSWDRLFGVVAAGGFAVLVGMWTLTFAFGFTAAPRSARTSLPPRITLPLHLLSTLGLLLVVTGLSEVAAESHEPLPTLLLWLMCGGLTLHFAVGALSGLMTGAPRSWVWTYAVPTALVPLLVAALVSAWPDDIGNGWLVWLLALPIGWQVAYARKHLQEGQPAAS